MNITIQSLDDIRTVAKEFIKQIGDNRLFAFYGNMGAGKTTFIKAICEELGIEDVITSPTFAIVNEYELPADSHYGNSVYHFDFYRIKQQEELMDMGFEEYVYSNNLCFMEWPELVEEALPEDVVRIQITANPDGTRTVRSMS